MQQKKAQASYAVVGGRMLRKGYTTGTCAAAAASAACRMLLTGERLRESVVVLPGGQRAVLSLDQVRMDKDRVSCAVTKDGGDDPDVTTGLAIEAEASFCEPGADGKDAGGVLRKEAGEEKAGGGHDFPADEGTNDPFSPWYEGLYIRIEGGDGVGRVTAEGLSVPVGEAAINPVPRRMIKENVARVIRTCEEEKRHSGKSGIRLLFRIEGGSETAKKTFNPKLGIVGGLSIIGTTGIVEPMSEKALVETVKIMIDKAFLLDPENILITPGNYGEEFCRNDLRLDLGKAVQISNYVGEALDYIRFKGFRRVLFVGHTGKLIKTGAGIMNTHSSYADGRMEIIAAHAGAAGADAETVRRILDSITTDQALGQVNHLEQAASIKASLVKACLSHLRHRLGEDRELELVMFTHKRDCIMQSTGAEAMIRYFRWEDSGTDDE